MHILKNGIKNLLPLIKSVVIKGFLMKIVRIPISTDGDYYTLKGRTINSVKVVAFFKKKKSRYLNLNSRLINNISLISKQH